MATSERDERALEAAVKGIRKAYKSHVDSYGGIGLATFMCEHERTREFRKADRKLIRDLRSILEEI